MRLSTPDPEAAPIRFDAVDLTDPMLYGCGDPHPIWHQMRKREPVRWHTCSNGLGFWSVTMFRPFGEPAWLWSCASPIVES